IERFDWLDPAPTAGTVPDCDQPYGVGSELDPEYLKRCRYAGVVGLDEARDRFAISRIGEPLATGLVSGRAPLSVRSDRCDLFISSTGQQSIMNRRVLPEDDGSAFA